MFRYFYSLTSQNQTMLWCTSLNDANWIIRSRLFQNLRDNKSLLGSKRSKKTYFIIMRQHRIFQTKFPPRSIFNKTALMKIMNILGSGSVVTVYFVLSITKSNPLDFPRIETYWHCLMYVATLLPYNHKTVRAIRGNIDFILWNTEIFPQTLQEVNNHEAYK